VAAFAALAQGTRLVLGHPEEHPDGAEPPNPVEREVAREVAGVRVERSPREGERNEGGQRERKDEQRPVRRSPALPRKPVGKDGIGTTHIGYVSSPNADRCEDFRLRLSAQALE
jgi:hypothetical protein